VFSKFKKNKTSTEVIGLDLDAASIRLAKLAQVGSHYQLTHYAIEPLAPNIIVEGEFKNRSALCAAIERTISKAGVSDTNVVLAIPDALVISKVIQLDASLSEQEIEAQITLESDQYIPYPIAELNFDFQVLAPCAHNVNEVDVLLVACHKKHLQERIEVLQDCGINIAAIEVESHAIERALHKLVYANFQEAIAVVDIRVDLLKIIVWQNSKAVFVRCEFLLDSFDVASIAVQIQRHLQFFFSAHPGATINQVYLIGEDSYLKELGYHLAVKSQLISQLSQKVIAPHLDSVSLTDLIPQLWLSCGLALWNCVGLL